MRLKNKRMSMKKWEFLTLQQKLTAVFAFTSVLILAVNLYMGTITNALNERVEDVFLSNVRLNDLSEAIDRVQGSMEEYLNTKSSEAMEDYFRSEQDYRELIGSLHTEVTDNQMLLAEKNIHHLSEEYLELVSDAIQAKRGRNVERYGVLYEEANTLYKAIHAFIYSLNNEQFRDNSHNYQNLTTELRRTQVISITMLFFILLGNVSLIFVSTRMVTKPLKTLAQAANEVAKGNFQIKKLPVESMDEVGIVTGAFNQMVESIRNYIEQLRLTMERENSLKEQELMMQSHLKEAQLKYLQAQINPHFLFNTLNAGSQLAMMEGAEKTEQFLEHTAEFFRYNVRQGRQDAMLEEEIRLVDHYIYIMNVRYSGEILFTKEVDETLLSVRVPCMILQPLVENAVKYGVREIDWPGRIELSVYRDGENISISIWDNGAGMGEEKIRQVLSGQGSEEEGDSNTNGVGIHNVLERLRLYFHGNAKLEILSGEGMGTEILITIPSQQEVEEKDVSDYVGG